MAAFGVTAEGIAALSRQNYRLLRALFGLKVKYDGHRPEQTVAAAIFDQAVLSREEQHQALGNRNTPLSDRFFEILRDPLREYLPGDREYSQTFDWFEYLLGLCHCDAKVSRADLQDLKAKDPKFNIWASVGRYCWNEGSPDILAETELIADQPYPEKVTKLLEAGFFESAGQQQNSDKYREVKEAFDRLVTNVRAQWRF
jgi:hypothetical protein